jgi:hypothetical protein
MLPARLLSLPLELRTSPDKLLLDVPQQTA